jgi:hypothetical protein
MPLMLLAMEQCRFHPDGNLLQVTFSVVEWLTVFVTEAAFKIVTESRVRPANGVNSGDGP